MFSLAFGLTIGYRCRIFRHACRLTPEWLMELNPEQVYLEQLAGLSAFLDWMRAHERQGFRFQVQDSEISCDARLSRRLAIGIPKHSLFGREAFLAVQSQEALFLRLMRFSTAFVTENSSHLALVSAMVPGDRDRYPDLPPLAMLFALDHPSKGDELLRFKRLSARSCWLDRDPDGQMSVEVGSKDVLWSVPLARQGKNTPLATTRWESNAMTQAQLALLKVQKTNVFRDPGGW